jgi:DNA-binding MarR family transcriptional regulator
MRLQKETISEEEKSMERVYKIIRSEYIRRGEAYPIDIIERELIKATQLSKGNVHALLDQLARKDMDILITEKKQDLGKPIKMINFVSVTERFEKKDVAKQKAKKFLSERLYKTAVEKDRKTSRLKTDAATDKATSSFISSLSSDYSKKQRDADLRREKLKEKEISFSSVTENLKIQIYEIIKKEYIYRMENPEKIPDFYIPISEISSEIELATKITPGELYPILEDLNKTDIEISLEKNPDEPEDKMIRILPFADDNMNYALANFRPVEYSNFRIMVTKTFLKNLKTKKEKKILFQLKKNIPNKTESQKSWIELLDKLHKYYPIYEEEMQRIPDNAKIGKLINTIMNNFEKKQSKVE